MNNDTDPIWEQPAHSAQIGSLLTQYSSDRAGRFATSPGLADFLKGWSDREKAKLTSWILDHNRFGDVPAIQPHGMAAIQARRSLGFTEKIDRFLLMLEADKYRPGDPLPWRGGVETVESVKARNRAMLWTEAANEREFYAFRQALIDAAILKSDSRLTAFGCTTHDSG